MASKLYQLVQSISIDNQGEVALQELFQHLRSYAASCSSLMVSFRRPLAPVSRVQLDGNIVTLAVIHDQPERRKMMQDWADYLDKLKAGAEIIPINQSA